MIVGRESRSGIAAVGGPGHALCLPGGRIAPSGLPENAPDVAGRNTAAAPGFFRGCGGRAASRQRRTESENIASRGCGERARVRPRDLFPVRNPGFRRWPPVPVTCELDFGRDALCTGRVVCEPACWRSWTRSARACRRFLLDLR